MSSGGVVTRFYFNKEHEFTEHCSAFYSANLGPILGCDLKFGKGYVEHQQQHQNSGKYHQKQHKDSALELTQVNGIAFDYPGPTCKHLGPRCPNLYLFLNVVYLNSLNLPGPKHLP